MLVEKDSATPQRRQTAAARKPKLDSARQAAESSRKQSLLRRCQRELHGHRCTNIRLPVVLQEGAARLLALGTHCTARVPRGSACQQVPLDLHISDGSGRARKVPHYRIVSRMTCTALQAPPMTWGAERPCEQRQGANSETELAHAFKSNDGYDGQ
jgi:hypothetical protein